MRATIVIPARLESSRLPKKLLLRESGKFLIEHVYERACLVEGAVRVVIATDSEQIRAAAASFGAPALLTRVDHKSGTDRVAEAVRLLEREGDPPELVVNIQGDEPELDPGQVDRLIELMAGCDDPMGTLAEPIEDPADLERSQVVKVVLNHVGQALYFSRSAIPSGAHADAEGGARPLRHVGIYAYRPGFLQAFCQLSPVPLEGIERLEQLRALYHGHAIRVGVVEPCGARGIDTREDYERFLGRL